MVFWALATLVTLGAAVWIARPFLKSGTMEMEAHDSTISIYRDQLDEVERDLAAGIISEGECDAARQEIERRALQSARRLDQGFFVGRRSIPTAIGIVALCSVAVAALYIALGTPQAPDQPLAARQTELLTQRAAAGDIASSAQLLQQAAEETPEDFETWWMLAKSYSEMGDDAAAAEAYRRAAELSNDNPGVLSAYAEAMTLANGNKVPAAARVIFEQVVKEHPDPRARYYIALAKAQSQDFHGAITDWAALLGESAPNAPWATTVRRDIVNMARFLKADVRAYMPDATQAEIAAAGGASQGAASAERVSELEATVSADPTDHKAWIALAGQHAALGDGQAALAALEKARSHFKAAPFVLQKFDETARALGLDMLDRGPGTAGPDAEQIAAASRLSQQDQDDMIEGMVAGLAAKLEENPDNLDGWIMLVRSYANLGRIEKARAAYDAATAQYSGNAAAIEALREGTAGVIAAN
ncbi:cytochrome c-type biogenesis protein CcmH [Aliiruegeria haliotis]|uniref:Cytochrome c-type biogenesis protein CcmH n=1 Tax=Aliiruegeria haliotis TaxID=1280846 RepID=A0A2T0RQ03_9RHOB|nr:c-type cytochrome biogenesis protein CcmI [Aliiruegeria haliotis]PRY23231.1 cytochrome c-type biogenesis protein CcmH [Aliiruegeria haliotis]